MRHFLYLLLCFIFLSSCNLKLGNKEQKDKHLLVEAKRYDQLESRYLTTGDFSALQNMQTEYPQETRALIEDVLKLGDIDEIGINSRLLKFYQDTLLQRVIADIEEQYNDFSDINKELSFVFKRMQKLLPSTTIPKVYTQIGAFDQSIIVNRNTIGISLDKYLGSEYPLYKKFYTAAQRETMNRSYIVADCLHFYLMSLFPCLKEQSDNLIETGLHAAAVMWVTNTILNKEMFTTKEVQLIGSFMAKHPEITIKELLQYKHYRTLL